MLGVEEFGIFSLALSIGYLVYSIMEFGFDTLCVKSVARNDDQLLFPIFSARILTTFFGFILIVAISLLTNKGNIQSPLLLLGITFAFFSFFNLICSYFRGIEKMQYEAALLTFQRAGILVLAILIFMVLKTAVAASLSFLLSAFSSVIVACILFKKKTNTLFRQQFNVKKDELLAVLKMAFPLALAGCVWSVYYRIDNIMIAGFRNIAEVGIYSGAYKISEGIILPARVIMLVFFPRLSRLGIENHTEFYSFFNMLFWILVVSAVIISGVLYFISEPLLILVLGDQYSGSVAIFRILLLSVFMMYPGYLVTHALIALDLQQIFMYVILFSTIMNIGLNFLLIPAFGIKGAAWSTVCSDILMTSVCGYFIFNNYRRRACTLA